MRRRPIVGLAASLAVATGFILGAAPSSADPVSNDDVAAAQAQVDRLDAQAEAATEAYDQGQIALTGAQRSAAAAQSAVKAKQDQLAKASHATAALASATYRSAGVSTFLTFVSSADPQSFLDQASTISQISADRAQQIDVLRAARKGLADAERQAKNKADDAAKAQKALESQRNSVLAALSAKQAYLNGLKEQVRQQLEQAQQAAAARQAAADAQARAAASTSSAVTQPTVDIPVSSSDRGRAALQWALSQIGKPYVWAGAGPDSYDCSGLTMWAFAHVGISLPHSAAGQYGYGTHVSVSQLEPGDLVFFASGGYIGHVGIYYGGGQMVDAPHTGSTVGIHGLYSGLVGGTRL
ncbi:MAG TPA: NlpC/P60 family protein [Mycobacteriales bacterium]|nr:NlpC/P60 family protein [Mycobacteriales bacterium]